MSILARDISDELLNMATQFPVVTVLGPRQSGKTTLVRQLFKAKPYVSLENPDDRAFAESDPRSFLDNYPDGVILDEIQRLPILLSYIQGIVDQTKKKGLFILTGSHQHQLHQSISQSLAGRTALLKLLPFCLSELPFNLQNQELDYYLYHGMYPRVYDDTLDPTKFYRSYLQTYVERDVRQMINIKDLATFQLFIKLCASRVGQLVNANSLSHEVGVSAHTITQWLSILEASFIIFRLPPYFENFGKRLIKSEKLYFTDVGLACYCLDIHKPESLARDPLRGSLAENFMIMELIKHRENVGLEPNAYFYRDSNQHEIDLIIKNGHQLIPIEIKSSKTFHPSFLKGLTYLKTIAEGRITQGYLLYAGEQEQYIHKIYVANFHHIKKISEQIINLYI